MGVSFAGVDEVVEFGDTVSLCPNADLAGSLKRIVVPFERLSPIKRNGEMIASEIHTQNVPRARRDFHLRTLFLCALAFDCVVNSHVVLEGIGASNVIIVRVL